MHRDNKERKERLKRWQIVRQVTKASRSGCTEKIQRSAVSVAVWEGEERC